MNNNRIWTLGAGVAIAAILCAGAALGVQPHLAGAAAADASTEATMAQNTATEAEIARLTKVAAKQSELESTERALRISVPSTLRMNSLSRMIRDAAALNGVAIQTFSPSGPTEYLPAVQPKGPDDPRSPWFGKTDSAITAENFTVIPLSVTVTGAQSAVTAFATDAQRLERLYAVSTVTTTLDEESGVTTGVISGYVYTLAK